MFEICLCGKPVNDKNKRVCLRCRGLEDESKII